MSDSTTPDPPTPVNLTEAEAALMASFGNRWRIEFSPVLQIWCAQHISEDAERFVVDKSAAMLTRKLQAIEDAEAE